MNSPGTLEVTISYEQEEELLSIMGVPSFRNFRAIATATMYNDISEYFTVELSHQGHQDMGIPVYISELIKNNLNHTFRSSVISYKFRIQGDNSVSLVFKILSVFTVQCTNRIWNRLKLSNPVLYYYIINEMTPIT